MKCHNKPLYKHILALRENVQNRRKIFKFGNKKWIKFIDTYMYKFRRFWKSRAWDSNRYLASLRPFKFFSYWKRYKSSKLELKKFRLMNGHLSSRSSKIYLKRNKSPWTLKQFMESRLNNILYQCKFVSSFKEADQMILQKKVYVNERIVTAKCFLLRPGDTIRIHWKSLSSVWKNIKEWYQEEPQTKRWYTWPLPPKHLIINYKILSIVFGIIEDTNNNFNSFYSVNQEKLLNSRYI